MPINFVDEQNGSDVFHWSLLVRLRHRLILSKRSDPQFDFKTVPNTINREKTLTRNNATQLNA